MDLILIRLTASATAATGRPPPEAVVDILWVNSTPTDRLEYVSAREREPPDPESIDVALFLRSGPESAIALAHGLCYRAIHNSPVLTGWTVSDICESSDD
ncbi:MAG: hypothetical protein HOV87_32310 [Catenulispora sp.]|nr:hypothetical protein [Catenulispora sp.]